MQTAGWKEYGIRKVDNAVPPCHFQPCQREWVIRIPDRYVSNGAVARKTMELGEMNLEVELEDEDQECIHH
uniref:Uncharacterized protein n=1 Tax=Setaria digitata TaxID=48799 RepID=A0A915PFS1_9BILA